MFNRARFHEAVKTRGMTLSEVAKLMKINGATLYRKMYGISDFTRSEIEDLRLALLLTNEEADALFFRNESA